MFLFAPSYYSLPYFTSNNFSYDFTFPFFYCSNGKSNNNTHKININEEIHLAICAELLHFAFVLTLCCCYVLLCFISFLTKEKQNRRKEENYSNGLIDIIFFLICLLLLSLYIKEKKL